MMFVVLSFGLVAGLAFAAGYGMRAFLSHRRREKAKLLRQWRVPIAN